MRCSNKTSQNRRAVIRINGLQPQFDVEEKMKEDTLYNQVVRIAMKASRIVLIGVAIIRRKMRIRMMGRQRVDRQLGRNGQRKKSQVKARDERPYRSVVSQNNL
jgi:hypothetical protein